MFTKNITKYSYRTQIRLLRQDFCEESHSLGLGTPHMASVSVKAKGAMERIQKYSFFQSKRGCTAVNIPSDVLGL